MDGGDKRQSQDERPLKQDEAQDAREEYTTYREVEPGSDTPGDEGARREADLQPGPPREAEGEPDRQDQGSSRRSGG
jgi:hypothetical protein